MKTIFEYICGGLEIWLGLIFIVVLVLVIKGQASHERDIVFTNAEQGCKGGTVACSRTLWFNGDWSGTQLCKGHACVTFDSIFSEERK